MPGMTPPESLTLAARLKRDSVRSPTTPQTDRRMPRGMARTHVRPRGASVSRSAQTKTAPTAVPTATPPKTPSHDLAGEMRGMSLWRPNEHPMT